MEKHFSTILDSIYKLSLEEKLELKVLLEHNISNSRREEIYLNFRKALKEEKEEKLEYSSDINELKNNFL